MKTKFKINEEVIYKGRRWRVIRIIINGSGINYQIIDSYKNWATGYSSIPENELQKSLLDKEEKEYLEAVLKPFKDKVTYISKEKSSDGDYYIHANIDYIVYMDALIFPNFPQNSKMYAGMEPGKKYTLKELGLFEEE
jgi:hypothetical protein